MNKSFYFYLLLIVLVIYTDSVDWFYALWILPASSKTKEVDFILTVSVGRVQFTKRSINNTTITTEHRFVAVVPTWGLTQFGEVTFSCMHGIHSISSWRIVYLIKIKNRAYKDTLCKIVNIFLRLSTLVWGVKQRGLWSSPRKSLGNSRPFSIKFLLLKYVKYRDCLLNNVVKKH